MPKNHSETPRVAKQQMYMHCIPKGVYLHPHFGFINAKKAGRGPFLRKNSASGFQSKTWPTPKGQKGSGETMM